MATLLSLPTRALTYQRAAAEALARGVLPAATAAASTSWASASTLAPTCCQHHPRCASSPARPDVYDLRRTNPAIKVSKPPKTEARYMASLKERVDKITANLANQPKRIADYKKTLPPKPVTKGILQYIKKNAWEKD